LSPRGVLGEPLGNRVCLNARDVGWRDSTAGAVLMRCCHRIAVDVTHGNTGHSLGSSRRSDRLDEQPAACRRMDPPLPGRRERRDAVHAARRSGEPCRSSLKAIGMAASGTGLTLAVLLHRRDEQTFIRSAQRYTLTLRRHSGAFAEVQIACWAAWPSADCHCFTPCSIVLHRSRLVPGRCTPNLPTVLMSPRVGSPRGRKSDGNGNSTDSNGRPRGAHA
jgi:hypothetical protein